MRRLMWILMVPLFVAGCMGDDGSPLHATPTGTEAGEGAFSLRVRVVEESSNGPPIAG